MFYHYFSYSTLEVLSTIEEISGALYIQGFTESTFPYLRNLRIVGSDDSEQAISVQAGATCDGKISIALIVNIIIASVVVDLYCGMYGFATVIKI